MSFTLRAKRVLIGATAGAMALSMLPAGVASADIDDVCANAPDADYDDAGTTHADNINCLVAYDIASGYDADTFGTFDPLRRGQAATLFVNFALVATDGAIADDVDEDVDVPFTDIDGTTHEANIEILFRLGLISGTTETTYSPNANISRAQFATILFNAHEALGVEFDEEYAQAFIDTATSVHNDQINALAGEGIISGTTATTYSPSENVMRGQTATLLMESAGLLDELGLWDADRLPPIDSNQTFMVTTGETQVPLGTVIDLTASVGDAEEVTIWLLDADDVSVSASGIVTFESDDDGDFDAGFAAGGNVITEVNGVAVPAAQTRSVDVADGDVEFSVQANTHDSFVALVAETSDGDDPTLDSDGAPVEAFGVSSTINVQDVEGVVLYDADRDDTIIDGATRPEGATVNVTAVLFDSSPLDDDSATVAIDGDLNYVIADSAVNAGTDPGSIAGNDTVDSGSVAVVDGMAEFSFEGGDDADTYTILVEWEAEEDSAYDGNAAFSFVGGTPAVATTHGQITFDEADAVGTVAAFVDADDQFVEVDGTASVAVEVTDQFGNAVSGVDVEFTVEDTTGALGAGTVIDGFNAANRVTNASGVATFVYSGDESRLDFVKAEVPAQDETAATAEGLVGEVEVAWYEVAGTADQAAADAIVFVDVDDAWVVTEDTGEYLRYNIEAGAVAYTTVEAGPTTSLVTRTEFLEFIEDELAGGVTLTTTGHATAGTNTEYEADAV